MKTIWDKIWNLEIDKRVLTLGFFGVLMVIVAPIARIMMYSVPWYDDFDYGYAVKIALENGASFWEAVKAAADNSKMMYEMWQGTYTSCFLMSLMPAAWSTDKYVIGLWIVFAIFVIGILFLSYTLLRVILKSDRWCAVAVSLVVTGCLVLLFRSPIEGLFWYIAAVHYTGMHAIGFLLLGVLVRAIYTENKVLRIVLVVLSMLLAALVGGSNYVTVLQMGLMLLSILVWGAIFKKKSVLWALPATITMAVGIYLNVSAPGNSRRMGHLSGLGTSPVEAILRSFQSAFTYLDDFTGWMTLAIVIALMPLVLQIVSKTTFQFKYPGLVLLWSFCMYATGFTPTLFTMGHTLISRATNLAKISFQMFLFVNLFYMIGWISRKGFLVQIREIFCKNRLCYYALAILMMIGVFALEPNKGGQYATYVSYYFVHTGEAYNYYHEYLDRVEICESEEQDVIVRPFVYKPWTLCLGDLSPDADYEPNRFMARFYHKNSIRCMTPEQETQLQE